MRCISFHRIIFTSGEDFYLCVYLFIFKQEHSFVHTCGVAATSVLAAVTGGTLFHKRHPSQEDGFQNANHV